jgi:hypothetical protein
MAPLPTCRRRGTSPWTPPGAAEPADPSPTHLVEVIVRHVHVDEELLYRRRPPLIMDYDAAQHLRPA